MKTLGVSFLYLDVYVFAIYCVSTSKLEPNTCSVSKSRLAKAAGAEPARRMKDDKLHAVVARSTFLSQQWLKTAGFATNFEVSVS